MTWTAVQITLFYSLLKASNVDTMTNIYTHYPSLKVS